MVRSMLVALLLCSASHAGAASLYSDLYGSRCKTLDAGHGGTRTRRCDGVAGYRLLVHEAEATTSVDVVSPRGEVWPLDYWDVVTPGLARVGRKAEWRMQRRGAQLVPTALLVRLDTASAPGSGPRMASGAILTAARIAPDGACVVYSGSATPATASAAANRALEKRRNCLGVLRAD
ncbi:hypothetical protein [Massilia sp. CF038]|uniref:hypothetical protein n=1 Tax=Massilia sp. CF038 TaxID=1881045 RepID=UPI00091E6BF0|nr:hypothetical protein [Massilia sp. CF038]SHH12632.1 hypothetical protein SAMN05428948_2910 [Massilia sp. CF038]